MKRKLLLALLVIGLLAFVAGGVHNIVGNDNKLKLQDVQLQDRSAQIKQLQVKYNLLNQNLDKELQQKNINQDKVKQLEQDKANLEKQTQDLQAQLQAKANIKAQQQAAAQVAATRAVNTVTGTATASAAAAPSVVGGCGDNSYANYIYMHESGCNLNAVNSGGCRGIGQACPGGKLPCGADYGCQNAYFTQYANSRYGGWEGAYSFWVNNHWW